jgi:hypothetical protein
MIPSDGTLTFPQLPENREITKKKDDAACLDAAPQRRDTAPMPPSPLAEARAALDAAGQLPDPELDLAGAALQFARIDAPDAAWRDAAATLTAIARAAVAAAAADRAADGGDLEARRACLAAVLHGRVGGARDAQTH